MARRADDVSRQSPTPAQGPDGSDLRSIAKQVEGLLDDDGQFNPNPDQLSRGHPDYDEDSDPRAKTPERDDRGRYKKAAASEDDEAGDTGPQDDAENDDELDVAASDDLDADAGNEAGDTDDDLATSAGDDAQTDDAETDGAIQTLAEFAEALEMPIDELKAGLTHTFNAADGEVTVTLAELEKGYQKDADYRRSTAKLADDRRAAEGEYQNRMMAFEQQNHYLAQQMSVAEQIVSSELNDPRLAELRERDPAEWTARRDEIGQRLGYLRNARNEAAAAYEQFTNNNRAQLRQREEKSLLEAIPDFGPEHKATVKTLMGSLGYSEPEMLEIFDHRVIQGALELASLRAEVQELRELKDSAADTVRRVKKDIPKLTKPGKQRRAGGGIKRDNVARLREKARKSGSIGDAAKVIETMI